jgi:PAS domain S-box-containing protein
MGKMCNEHEIEKELGKLRDAPEILTASQNSTQVEQTEKKSSEIVSGISSENNENTMDIMGITQPINKDKNSDLSKDLSEKYRLIALSTSDLISFTTFDTDPIFTFVSPSHKKILGFEEEELLGKSGLDFIHDDDKEHILTILLAYIDAKINGSLTNEMLENPPKLDFRFRDKSGQWHFLHSTVDIVNNELLFVSKDITEQKRVEAELYESNELFSKAFRSSPEMITISTIEEGRYIDVNESFLRTSGYCRDEVIGHTVTELNIWFDPGDRVKFVQELKEQGSIRNLEIRTRKKTGEIVFALISSEIIDINGEPCALTITTDITERKRTEIVLQENEKRLNAIIQGLSIAAFFLGRDHQVVYWNKALEELSKIRAEEVIGTTNQWKAFYTEKRPCMADILIDGDIKEIEKVYAGIYKKSSLLDESYEAIDFFPKLGNEGKWLRFAATVIRNTSGDLVGVLETLEDISESKKMEYEIHEKLDILRKSELSTLNIMEDLQNTISALTTAEIEIREKNKELQKINTELTSAREELTSLNRDLEKKVKERTADVEKLLKQKDEFIGQLGHDLKTPLTPLNILIPIIKEQEKDPKLKELLDVISNNILYMKNLVTKTLALAQLNSPNSKFELRDSDLSVQVRDILDLESTLFDRKRVIIENNIPAETMVQIDVIQIRELFDNLISNAIKYSQENSIKITLDAKKKDDFIVVSIKDTGIGLESGQIQHVFEEFYKVDYSRHDLQSTGLGLSICKRIVEKHGGSIWVESEGKGKGSTFYFTLPIAKTK